MSKSVTEVTIGIDVCKQSLDILSHADDAVSAIPNALESIVEFLDSFTEPVVIALEATNTFHELIMDQALQRGYTVYLIDGYRLNKYREAVGVRAKNDCNDAQLLRRYLLSERSHLRAVQAQSKQQRQLWRLLKRRAKLVKMKTELKLSLSDISVDAGIAEELSASFSKAILRITKLARCLIKQLDWQPQLTRLRTIPGVGELNAMALMVMFNRGVFANVDRFIAFIGLDVRVRESGAYRGRSKLTKKGDPEVRRLLFNGARSAARSYPQWQNQKQELMNRGLSEIQVSVIQSRKIARIAYSLMRTGEVYESANKTCHAS